VHSRQALPPDGGLSAADTAALVRENHRGLGVLYRELVRDVLVWADAGPAALAHVASPAALRLRQEQLAAIAADDPLRSALELLARLTDSPAAIRAAEVANACEAVSTRCDSDGAPAAALAFAVAFAAAEPSSAPAAVHAGRMARRHARYGIAETWLRHAVRLASRSGDHRAFALGYVALGNMHLQRGDLPAARRELRRAVRAAARNDLPSIEAAAWHDLVLTASQGEGAEACLRYARRAFELYGPHHPRLSSLAHDLAYLWLQRGKPNDAFPVFEAVLEIPLTREDRVAVLGNMARCAGEIGDEARFRAARAEIQAGVVSAGARLHVAEALVEVARGAAALGWVEDAASAAQSGLEIATDRQESRIVAEAEAFLTGVHGVGTMRRERVSDTAVLPCSEGFLHLTAEILRCLRTVPSPP
jgi:tetratricopeptide (TPR) repeat protein